MVAHDENIGIMLKKLDESRYRREYHRHVLDRQRAALQRLARCRDHAVQVGEEHQLGGRMAGAGVRALARPDQGRNRAQRDRLPPGHAADAPGRRRRAGDQRKLLEGHTAGSKTFRVHIDGFNMLPYLTGEAAESPRESFFYISDDGDILAIRHNDWKAVLMEQRAKQTGMLDGTVRAPQGRRRSSTCGGTRSSGPTRTRTPTGTG